MSYLQTIYRWAWAVLGVLVVVALLLIFLPKIHEYREIQQRKAEIQEQMKREKAQIQQLKEKQKRFQTDPRFVEHVAHGLGMAKPNETIIKFVENDPEPAPADRNEN